MLHALYALPLALSLVLGGVEAAQAADGGCFTPTPAARAVGGSKAAHAGSKAAPKKAKSKKGAKKTPKMPKAPKAPKGAHPKKVTKKATKKTTKKSHVPAPAPAPAVPNGSATPTGG